MVLTILTIIFILYYTESFKQGSDVKYFWPLATLIIGIYLVSIIPLNFMVGWMIILSFIITVTIMAFMIKSDRLRGISKRTIKVLFLVITVISLYTQFFNGIETFYSNPSRYFYYSKQITYRYYFIPPKIMSIKSEDKDYVYSLTQYKNAFFIPESMTHIGIYEGKAWYYYAVWKFGKVPSYYRRYFSNDKFIDSPV